MLRACLLGLIIVLLNNLGLAGKAHAYIGYVCDKNISRVAQETSVPEAILYGIARLETGRTIEGQYMSWPWALNNGGAAYYLGTKDTALKKLRELRSLGKTNIDVGCMQLNVKWHARYFESYEAMIDPYKNIRYAARYLGELYQETGSWEKAVRYYHSRNAKYHDIYFRKFQKIKMPNAPRLKGMAFAQATQSQTFAKPPDGIIPLIDLSGGTSGSLFRSMNGQQGSAQPLIILSGADSFSASPLMSK